MEKFVATGEDLTQDGEGIVRWEGLVVFVPGLLIDERAEILLESKKKNYAIGKILRIIQPSPLRTEPICPHFEECGGCTLMHLAYEGQLEWKKKQVKDALWKIGHLQPEIEDVFGLNPLYYRNKIAMPTVWTQKGLHFGLYKKRSINILPIDRCYIHEVTGETVYEQICRLAHFLQKDDLRHLVLRTSFEGKVMVLIISKYSLSKRLQDFAQKIYELKNVVSVHFMQNQKRSNVIYSEHVHLLFGEEFLKEKILGIDILVSPKAFFQINRHVAEKIYQKAYEISEVKKGMKVLDAYCGVGSFALFLAKKQIHVKGIEIVHEAIASAKKNAKNNHLHVDFQVGAVEKMHGDLQPFDVVFLNPPRKGCDEKVIRAIAGAHVKRVVYTSCSPQTFARDAWRFSLQGYQLQKVYPFDLFPQSGHVELVAGFVKEEANRCSS